MNESFLKINARVASQRYGFRPSNLQQRMGDLRVEQQKLMLGGEFLVSLPMLTAGGLQEQGNQFVVILLCWGSFDRIEIKVDSAEEGHRLLTVVGFADLQRPMSFEIIAESKKPRLKALAMILLINVAMIGIVLGMIFLLKSKGYNPPEWVYSVIMVPVALTFMALLWRMGSTPVNLNSQGLEVGRGAKVRKIPFSSMHSVKQAADGVQIDLTSGENIHLKTRGLPKIPDPIGDVLFGAIVAARAFSIYRSSASMRS